MIILHWQFLNLLDMAVVGLVAAKNENPKLIVLIAFKLEFNQRACETVSISMLKLIPLRNIYCKWIHDPSLVCHISSYNSKIL